MKFAVGYQEPENGENFSSIVSDYLNGISEVYFSWPGSASGRSAATGHGSQARMETELAAIRSMGVRLDMLFNANCYGGSAISTTFESEIISLLEYLDSIGLLPDVITTTSPFVARTVKKSCQSIEIRASVNMRIDSISAMDYASEYFDSFYMRRDVQRDIPTVARFKKWCDVHGKKLGMLLNSGCLRNCPSQTFHDNLVAHDMEVSERRNVKDWIPHLCWNLYQKTERRIEFLKSSWIRPEDVRHYEDLVSFAKLATRRHQRPRVVIGAYISGKFSGNLLNLTEPDYSALFAPFAIDNTGFPEDWHKTAGLCASNCTDCGKCMAVYNQVSVRQ